MKKPLLVLSIVTLLFALLLSGCGGERIVYIPVTVTPEGGSAGPAAASPVATAALGDPAAALPSTDVSAPTPVPANPGIGATDNPNLTLPADGSRIAFMGTLSEGGAMQTLAMNPDGSGLTHVSRTAGEGYFPSFSPDSSQVVLVSNTQTDPDIFVVDVATGEATNLTNKPGFDNMPVWSPDGSQIAFITDRDGGDIDLWVMDRDGANARRLAETSGEDALGSWSPDGTQLVYSNKSEVGTALWIMDVATGEATRLGAAAEGQQSSDNAPAWSPDGETIAFYSEDSNGVPSIYTIKPDGTERQQITPTSTPALFPVWSPDGEWLLYTAFNGETQTLTTLNLQTKETRTLPDVQGFATSWRPALQRLADSGFTQGPRMAGVEVDPAVIEAAYKLGDDSAPVKVVEFSDYQCPFCERWFTSTYPQVKTLIEQGTVQLIFVDFPLNIHPQAPAASQAARCAGELGGSEAYWKMHDALFTNLQQWSGQQQPAPIFQGIAQSAGLDGDAIKACVDSGKFNPQVNAGLAEGTRLGVTGTPTFFVNGTRLVGALPWESFEPVIQAAAGGQ